MKIRLRDYTLDPRCRVIDCGECQGAGLLECPECKGLGVVEESRHGRLHPLVLECERCGGAGLLSCKPCEGHGMYADPEWVPPELLEESA